MREFYAWGTHKDLSNIYSWDKECLDSKISQNRYVFNPRKNFPGRLYCRNL